MAGRLDIALSNNNALYEWGLLQLFTELQISSLFTTLIYYHSWNPVARDRLNYFA